MNEPTSLREISDCITDHRRVAVAGARTKPRLSRASADATLMSLAKYTGITDYQASEFTIVVRAGTPMAEVIATLAERGQYLPFDPLWVKRGATVGGTIAANASGPGRIRFGGIRDFIIGATVIDGRGQSLRSGGKVVKNAAGFDTPKFMVGTLGRWGAIAEATFKVFPRPPYSASRIWQCADHEEARQRIAQVARSRWEPTAIEYLPKERQIWVRLSGPEKAANGLLEDVGGEPGPSEADWAAYNELTWADNPGSLIRVPLSLNIMPTLLAELESPDHRLRVGGAGSTLWINSADDCEIESVLRRHHLKGLNHRDNAAPLRWGVWRDQKVDRALQAVFDPDHRFTAFC